MPHPRLSAAAGLTSLMDDGFTSLDEQSATDFISRCGQLRFWARQDGMVRAAAAAG